MAENTEMSTAVKATDGGRIVFANDVIATIAALAAADVAGVAGMNGGVVEGITEKLGRKSLTKGVKVEVGQEEAAVDLTVIIQYGYRIQEVCANVQAAVKNAIETMTGLRVVEVNVYVYSINFESPEDKEEKIKAKEREREEKARAKEKPAKEIEPPRVK